MSEKLKPNFTPVPNVLLDEVMHKLPPGAAKVMFAICRFTYGYGKPNGDRISLQQLQDVTGMARGSVARSLKDLGTLIAVNRGDPSRQLASEYRINIEIPDDELVSLCDQASLLASRIKRPSKENQRKKNIPAPEDPEFERAWARYPKRAGDNPKEKARSAWRARVREGVGPDEMIAGVERYAAYIRVVGSEGTQYVKQAATFFGPDKHWRDDWAPPQNTHQHSVKPSEKEFWV